MTIRLIQAESQEQWRQVRQFIDEYAASLNVDLSFQNIGHELENLATEYAAPAGALLLAEENGTYLGCVGLRPFEDGVGEIKRLYVGPSGRGRGVGRLLVEGVVAAAKQQGYRRLVLDTLPFMKEARSLYASLGFKPTSPYRFNPVPATAYLEKML